MSVNPIKEQSIFINECEQIIYDNRVAKGNSAFLSSDKLST